jgi:arginyl-tRNA synthetase
MNILAELKSRFATALASLVDDSSELVEMVRTSQDPKFGDYQANCAMPLGKQLDRPPREIAQQIVDALDVSDLCEPPELAGPGFINLRLKDDWITEQINAVSSDKRLGVEPVSKPRTYVIDYSAPNVAKPMHVGHIRSTVIGDSLGRTLKFLGHKVISDNHIGDWGTQFGMIIYGYRNFCDDAAYQAAPVQELARLYRLVNQLVEYHDDRPAQAIQQKLSETETHLQRQRAVEPTGDKKADKALRRLEGTLNELQKQQGELERKKVTLEADPTLGPLLVDHEDIGQAVLKETANLHSGDAKNLALWKEFLPPCREEINKVYRRLNVTFDHTLGESFYHDRLALVVEDLRARGIAIESDGAICVFFGDDEPPMIVQKKDGAFLYSTTDLATVQYRLETWQPDAILYVVDHRQSLHFDHLFATVRKADLPDLELQHVSFGTVLDDSGRPYKTRSGDTVGLESLLDESVARALQVVSENDDAKPGGAELSTQQREEIAETVGIAALKYADLSHSRTSDYVFSYDKMLALSGNTATYMQYAYARVQNIFSRGKIEVGRLRADPSPIMITEPAERALTIMLLRFSEALALTVADYRPNMLTNYLFELAGQFSTFYQQCLVLKADTAEQRVSRLKLSDVTSRVLRQGLTLLGIDVVDKM